MFTTFVGIPHCSTSHLQADTPTLAPLNAGRPRRRQVARACDWCRVHRVKCDSSNPCHNCRIKGRQCRSKGKDEVRTFALATREIERLKLRVQELEGQLENHNVSSSRRKRPVKPTVSLPTNLDPFREHGGNRRYWECIYTRTAQSPQRQCYGPSSSFYFVGRMSSYLGMALQQPQPDHSIQPNSASRSFASPVSVGTSSSEENLMQLNIQMSSDYLSRTQEEYFLDLFWQSYHCIYPVVDEIEFREHYNSLWSTSGASRKPSILVDIVLAICMQYGAALISPNDSKAGYDTTMDSNDATIAGRWFYRRCQTLLTNELEGPSITTVQCHIFSVIWLSNASFQNMAHSILALAVRTGIILGLHLEPPEDLPRAQREYRKRLWWTLYSLEIKTCMELGRPLAVNISQVTCSLPSDDHGNVVLSGSAMSSSLENATWLTFNLQCIKLILATRGTYVTFYDKCADVFSANGEKSLYNDPRSLEACAEFLTSKMKFLQTWLHGVPDALRTIRKGAGESFSMDRSPLDLKPSSPFWLQRQRLLLELLYHNVAMCLYRPFICFYRTPGSRTPLTESNATMCVHHAITMTYIIHQMLTETDLLNGWHEVFQWQWNATLSLIGYVLAYPVAPSTSPARKAISIAIKTFEVLGSNFDIAASAANVAKDLNTKADLLTTRLRNSLNNLPPSFSIYDDLQNYESDNLDVNILGKSIDMPQIADGSSIMLQDIMKGSTVPDLTIDSLNSLESTFTAGSTTPDIFGQNQQFELFAPFLPESLQPGYEIYGWNLEALDTP